MRNQIPSINFEFPKTKHNYSSSILKLSDARIKRLFNSKKKLWIVLALLIWISRMNFAIIHIMKNNKNFLPAQIMFL